MIRRVIFAVVWTSAILLTACQSRADIITQWNFNSVVPDSNSNTGTTTPYIGTGVASLVGGTTAIFGPGSPGDTAANDDSSWITTTYAQPSRDNKTRGVQFAVDTRGYKDIRLTWDQNTHATSSRYFQFQYSVDGGSSFVDYTLLDNKFAGTWTRESVDLSSLTGVNFNANVVLRLVAAFAPGTTNYVSPDRENGAYSFDGTRRFDMVTVHGTVPEPGTLALLGVGLVTLVGVRTVRARRRSATTITA